jgi:hypothetical protein
MSKEIPSGEVEIAITKRADGSRVVRMRMNKETFSILEDTARRRGLGIIGTIGEALRLERLLANLTVDKDASLLVRERNKLKELSKV